MDCLTTVDFFKLIYRYIPTSTARRNMTEKHGYEKLEEFTQEELKKIYNLDKEFKEEFPLSIQTHIQKYNNNYNRYHSIYQIGKILTIKIKNIRL
jgi:hypothetical protein